MRCAVDSGSRARRQMINLRTALIDYFVENEQELSSKETVEREDDKESHRLVEIGQGERDAKEEVYSRQVVGCRYPRIIAI